MSAPQEGDDEPSPRELTRDDLIALRLARTSCGVWGQDNGAQKTETIRRWALN